ncbi:MAG: hypothetical protein K8S27_15925 [Candidatus Omnitrophica bacterium]|nr:hypothetical protein [Candidatus Omnitrophota bacterium]
MERIKKTQSISPLRRTILFPSVALVLIPSLVLGGCATYPKVKVNKNPLPLTRAETETPEELLLDVRIKIFDPGKLPKKKDAARGLSEEIRKAEGHFIAAQLKNTMLKTGKWGAIRVVPDESSSDEILVSGGILKSNGEVLEVKIEARDATGRNWVREKKYSTAVDTDMYRKLQNNSEIFQNIYNQISNDLAAYFDTLTPEQIREIRQISEISFAERLAPEVFTGYLQKDPKKNIVKIDRLPSDDDAMLARIRRVRERDYMLVDTIDQHFSGLHREMTPRYNDWRKSRLDEMNMIREVDAKKRKHQSIGAAVMVLGTLVFTLLGVLVGSSEVISSGVSTSVQFGAREMFDAQKISEEAEINKRAMEEMGVSFRTDIEPTIIEVEGETIKLTGSAKAKYQQWSEVIGKLYKLETGAVISSVNSAVPE